MSDRKNRRQVLAELLLLADPTGIHVRDDGGSLTVEFDSLAALRSWLHLAGLDTDALLTGERDGVYDGRPYRSAYAYPTWHGWEIYAQAREYTDQGGRLDPGTADRLAALATAEATPEFTAQAAAEAAPLVVAG